MKDAAGGLLSPLGPSPLCDYSVVSDNSLLLYQVHRGKGSSTVLTCCDNRSYKQIMIYSTWAVELSVEFLPLWEAKLTRASSIQMMVFRPYTITHKHNPSGRMSSHKLLSPSAIISHNLHQRLCFPLLVRCSVSALPRNP